MQFVIYRFMKACECNINILKKIKKPFVYIIYGGYFFV